MNKPEKYDSNAFVLFIFKAYIFKTKPIMQHNYTFSKEKVCLLTFFQRKKWTCGNV